MHISAFSFPKTQNSLQSPLKLKSNTAEVERVPKLERVKDMYEELVRNEENALEKYDTSVYEIAVAIDLKQKLTVLSTENQIKLIQFHPSFSYEDFVRGIEAEPMENGVSFKAKNRILGQFSEEALKNYKATQEDNTEFFKSELLDEYFDLFIESIQEEIDENGFVELTKKWGLIAVDEDAFRYSNSEGTTGVQRMLFKDIKQAFMDGNTVRQDLKKNKKLSRLAFWHASYYVKALNLFQDFIKLNNLSFEKEEGNKPELKNYVLIIDEINRANLSAVLGELIYALEYRGEAVESMYKVDGDNALSLPPNLYIIGTMNTADRSVGHVDYAVRRRFAFVDVLPKDLSDETDIEFASDLFEEVSSLFINNYDTYVVDNDAVLEKSATLSPEFEPKDVWLGHSYFIDKTEEGGTMKTRLKYEIKPILREYVKDGILIGENIIERIENLHV